MRNVLSDDKSSQITNSSGVLLCAAMLSSCSAKWPSPLKVHSAMDIFTGSNAPTCSVGLTIHPSRPVHHRPDDARHYAVIIATSRIGFEIICNAKGYDIALKKMDFHGF